MRKSLRIRYLAIHFKYENNFTVQNILFPSIWQQNPRKTNPNFKRIKLKNQQRITKTLKIVVKFITDSHRFKLKKYGI